LGIQKLVQSKKKDEYMPVLIDKANLLASKVNVYQTVLEVIGKGFISKNVYTISNGRVNIKVTIDGVVIWENAATLNSNASGFCLEEYLFVNNGFVAVRVGQKPMNFNNNQVYSPVQLPNLDNEDNRTSYIPEPLYFNKSVKIEMKANVTTDAVTISILGGVEQ